MRLGMLAAGLVTAALATGGAVALSSGPAGAADYPVSSIGGKINVQEVLDRANNWYNRKLPYDTNGSASDLGNTRRYRTDCSGFIDMALHLGGTQDSTADYPGDSRFTRVMAVAGNKSKLSPINIHTGDVFDDTVGSEHHAFIFGDWNTDGVHFNYYSFGGGSGSAPPEHHTGATFSDATLGFEPTGHYVVYRYDKIDYSYPHSGPE